MRVGDPILLFVDPDSDSDTDPEHILSGVSAMHMHIMDIKKRAHQYLMNTYGERDICLVRGDGPWVWDSEGKQYLDFLAGLGVCNLGHCHASIGKAIRNQAEELIHCSNLYYIEPQVKLAEMLCAHSFADKCFIANTGAEANEGAIKLARYYAKKRYGSHKTQFITFYGSFHGRTMATVTATGQSKFHQGFEPLLPGFEYAEFNNIDSVRDLIDEATCGVMIEPIQGEGGVHPAKPEFLRELCALCKEYKVVLIFDEVQCGLGRTGKNFAYEHYGVHPDILTLAKALGGGVPIGAVLAAGEIADAFDVGTHATTFGGNPLASSAAVAFLNELFGKNLARNASEIGDFFRDKLLELKEEFPVINEVRGKGLMVAIQFSQPISRKFYSACLTNGLLVNALGDYIIRFLPPIIISRMEVEKAIVILRDALKGTA
jgi:predicted acetylornithine/succinylornithine family transaminase